MIHVLIVIPSMLELQAVQVLKVVVVFVEAVEKHGKMQMRRILHYGNRISNQSLTTPCEPVEYVDKNIHKDIQQLHDTLSHYHKTAAGLAANQIGKTCRIFVYRNSLGTISTVINPYIIESSNPYLDVEGCLSFPETLCVINRYKNIHVKYMDFYTLEEKFEDFVGFTARLFQHEIEHLNGELFIDKLSKEERDEFLARYARNNRSSKDTRR